LRKTSKPNTSRNLLIKFPAVDILSNLKPVRFRIEKAAPDVEAASTLSSKTKLILD
jgi:hypothetical protein